MSKILKLKSKSDGKVIEGEYGKNGILFLVASQEGLKLVRESKLGSLVYAVFSTRLGSVYASAIHSTTIVSSASDSTPLKDGDFVSVGFTILVYVNAKPSFAFILRRRFKAFCVIVAALVVSALVIILFSKTKVNYQIKSGNDTKGTLSVDVMMNEVRGYLKSGDVVQAKMALEEAVDHKDSSDAARGLLVDIKKNEEMAGEEKLKIIDGKNELISKAENLFREGVRLKEDGNLIEAYRKLKLAGKIIEKENGIVSFEKDLADMKNVMREEIKNSLAGKIFSVNSLLSETKNMSASEIVDALSPTKLYFDSIADVMSDDGEYLVLSGQVKESVKIAGDRWLSSALTAEKFSGCGKALPMYEQISTKLKDAEASIVSDAKEGIARCGR